MTPTFLVVGATGNTGQSVVTTLSKQLQTQKTSSDYQILALTRSLNSPVVQSLQKLAGVKFIEYNWPEITAEWLQQHRVARAFIASHNQPNQFAEESTFLLAALTAGVEYLVRISTTAPNVRPDCASYYPRTHWAIEALLGSPEFERMQWTSLQPNVFMKHYLDPAAEFVKNYRTTGKQTVLKLMSSKDARVGIVDPNEVGQLAATLLLAEDPSIHNKAKYVVNGPNDITGLQLLELVERSIGTKVEDVRWKDMSFIDQVAATTKESKNVILSIKHAPETAWAGKCSVSTTSPEVLKLYTPTITPSRAFELLLSE